MAEGMFGRFRNGLAGFVETEDRAYSDEVIGNLALRYRTSELIVSAVWSASRMAALTMTRGDVMLDGMTAAYWQPAITRDFLFQACFDMFVAGNAVYYLGNGGTGSLRRIDEYEVKGDKPPYAYLINMATPNGNQQMTVTAAEILHLKIGSNANTPWQGRSVFADSILQGIDLGFKIGSRLPTQRFMPFPVDKMAGVNIQDQEKTTRSRGKAEVSAISATSGVYQFPNTTNRGAQKIDVTDVRFSPDGNAVSLREQLVSEIWESVGYPPALRSDAAPGQAARQEFGRWVDTYLQPVCDMLADQLAASLECDVDWDLSPARVPLVTDQATALRTLIRDGKISVEQAGRIVGLNIESDMTMEEGEA